MTPQHRNSSHRHNRVIGVLCVVAGLSVFAVPSVVEGATTVEQVSGYATVQMAFLREEFERVVGLAQSFILEHPDEPDVPRVWLWLILSLDKLQQSSEALRELNRLKGRLPATDPVWPEVLYWEGDISRRSMQMVRAKITFQRLLERFPDSSWAVQAHLGMGLVDLHQQAFESALVSFQQVALREPDSPSARDAELFEGICLLQLKRFSDAAAVFAPLVDRMKEPANVAQTAFYLGESLSGQGRFEEAVAAYQRAVAIQGAPQWSRPAQFGLGWAFYRLGRCDDSVKLFERFLRAGTTDHQTEAWFAQGSCLVKLDRGNDALPFFERILSRDPRHPLAAESGLIIADAYRRQGRSALAADLLHRLLDRPLDQAALAQVQLRLGSLALEEGNAAQAKTLFQLAREATDATTRRAALSGLGDVALFAGDLAAARQSYEEVIRQQPDASLARYATYQLGRMAMQAGAFTEAVATFQRLATAAESEIADDARLALALAYLRQNEESLARSTLEEMRRRQRDSPGAARAAYYLALILLNDGDTAGAKALCQEAIAKAPSTDEAADARLLLADIVARQASVSEAKRWLQQAYTSSGMSRRQRAKLAKRLGDLAREERHYAEAILWYDETANWLPALRGESEYRIASCYEEAGDLALAMSWYRHLTQEPWRVRGQLALAKLLEREGREMDAAQIYRALAAESIPEAKVAAERLAAAVEASRAIPPHRVRTP